MNLYAIIIGSMIGLFVGFVGGWLFDGFGWVQSNLGKTIVGAILGGLFGGVAGSISGDANRRGDTSSKFIQGFIFGAIFGAIGGSRFYLIGILLSKVHIQHPFPR